MEWLNLVEIALQLAACYACYLWGKTSGISLTVNLLLEKQIIKESDLDKLQE